MCVGVGVVVVVVCLFVCFIGLLCRCRVSGTAVVGFCYKTPAQNWSEVGTTSGCR